MPPLRVPWLPVLVSVLFMLPCLTGSAWAQSDDVIALTPSMGDPLDATRVQYAIETSPLTVTEVVAGTPDLHWQSVDKSVINLRIQTRPVWFRFRIQNATAMAGDWYVSIPWPMLNRIRFVQIHQDGTPDRIYDSGFDVPFSQQFQQRRQYLFPIHLQAGEGSTLLLRIESRAFTFVPMMLWSAQRFVVHDSQGNIIYGLAFGMLLALLLYNLSLYVFVRDRTYLLYSLYALAVLFYELSMTGFGVKYLWPDDLWWQGNSFSVMAVVTFIFASLFMRDFLNLTQYGGWWLRSNTLILAYWCVALVANFLGWYGFLLATVNPMALLTTLVASVVTIGLWLGKGSTTARYFTIAWSFLMAATVVVILVMEGVLPFSPVTENIQLVGFVVEMLALSYALAERINRERRQREEAQALAIQMMQQINEERNAKLEAQARAMAMQQEHTDELEMRVLDRTAELERAMSNLELANKELAKLSVTDPLTRLHNRRYFDQMLSNEIERSIRTHTPLALVLVDIDHFKSINDTYGHLIGDECLKLVSSTLRQVVSRSTDLVARYGGEEFGVILPATGLDDAGVLAERMRQAIEKVQFIHLGKRIPISASMGVSGGVLEQGVSPASLITTADEALYRAKENGRNQVMYA